MARRSNSLPPAITCSGSLSTVEGTRDVQVSQENAATAQLEAAFRNLVVEGDFLDTTSEKGFVACQAFLEALEGASKALQLEPAPRAYRASFTSIYRALFDDETRSYRVDMLEAGTSRGSVIWANGEEFKLSENTVRYSKTFWSAWVDLGKVLQQWIAQWREEVPLQPGRAFLCAALNQLDAVWANFEEAYVLDLMQVQSRARALITEAVAREHWLRVVEKRYQHFSTARRERVPAYHAARQDLVTCIARLNAVANSKRKGRDDLSVDVLESAIEVLWICEHADTADGTKTACVESAEVLASRVVSSFDALRAYLFQVQDHLDELLPNLCQNEGLVARLVEWEKSWEVGKRHVMDSLQLTSLSCFAAGLRRDRKVEPALVDMVTDYDPALFLTLPRLAWLHALAEPQGPVLHLVRRQLPHLFDKREDSAETTSSGAAGEVIQALSTKFRSAFQCLAKALPNDGVESKCMRGAAWELFIRRAVTGADAAADPYAVLAPDRREAAAGAVEGFMHELERWSMELQRQKPEDWNECVDLLVQCVAGTSRHDLPSKFVV